VGCRRRASNGAPQSRRHHARGSSHPRSRSGSAGGGGYPGGRRGAPVACAARPADGVSAETVRKTMSRTRRLVSPPLATGALCVGLAPAAWASPSPAHQRRQRRRPERPVHRTADRPPGVLPEPGRPRHAVAPPSRASSIGALQGRMMKRFLNGSRPYAPRRVDLGGGDARVGRARPPTVSAQGATDGPLLAIGVHTEGAGPGGVGGTGPRGVRCPLRTSGRRRACSLSRA
jgi:hypothetical protein